MGVAKAVTNIVDLLLFMREKITGIYSYEQIFEWYFKSSDSYNRILIILGQGDVLWNVQKAFLFF